MRIRKKAKTATMATPATVAPAIMPVRVVLDMPPLLSLLPPPVFVGVAAVVVMVSTCPPKVVVMVVREGVELTTGDVVDGMDVVVELKVPLPADKKSFWDTLSGVLLKEQAEAMVV